MLKRYIEKQRHLRGWKLRMSGMPPDTNGHTSASVAHSEICHSNKKYTVYKVVVSSGGQTWFVFRRYNDFHKLCDTLKKQSHGSLGLKLPGKKLFGNNFDPNFIQSRREGLDDFIQRVTSDERLCQHPEVRAFLSLDSAKLREESTNEEESLEESVESAESNEEKDDKPVNLGPTEKSHVKPSDFEFLKVIGKGTFGKVLLAKHKAENQIYAVKVLQKKMIIKRNETRHIMSERNVLLKNLNHPFLVGLHYSFQTRDKLYFVLDYVNGGELFFHLQRERYFPEARARFYAAEMASALGYLHTNGIVYRDLKPENILLESTGHIVLTDFGLSKEGIDNNKTTSTFCGTPEYLAPEILRKQAYDKSVDWWCLGAVLYEMLYGLPPFYSRDTAEMYDSILYKPLRLRTNISMSARNILEKLLQKEREKRLGSGEGDFEDVKQHDFFKSILWDELVAKKLSPPYIPNVHGALDLRNIDPEFTREPVPASVGKSAHGGLISASVCDADNAFMGFSYAPPMDGFS